MTKTIMYLFILKVALMACNSSSEKKEIKSDDKQKAPSSTISGDNKRELNTISAIRKEYEDIVQGIKNNELSSTSFEFDCHGEKTGKVTFYLQDEEVRMVEKVYNELSHRNATEQYFVADEKPFFVYINITDWVFDSGAEVADATRDNIKENRYYFVNDSLISCLEKNYEIRSASSKNPIPDQVKNNIVACPSAEELLARYQKLLGFKNEKDKIGCL